MKPLKELLHKFFQPSLLSDISFRDYAKKLAARSPKKEEDRKGMFQNWRRFPLGLPLGQLHCIMDFELWFEIQTVIFQVLLFLSPKILSYRILQIMDYKR